MNILKLKITPIHKDSHKNVFGWIGKSLNTNVIKSTRYEQKWTRQLGIKKSKNNKKRHPIKYIMRKKRRKIPVWYENETNKLVKLIESHGNEWSTVTKELNKSYKNNRTSIEVKTKGIGYVRDHNEDKLIYNVIRDQLNLLNNYWEHRIYFSLYGFDPNNGSTWKLSLNSLTHNGVHIGKRVVLSQHIYSKELVNKSRFPKKHFNITTLTFEDIGQEADVVQYMIKNKIAYFIDTSIYSLYLLPSSFDYINKDIRETWLTPLIGLYFDK